MKRKVQYFTLVEMLTVVAIIGILTAIVAPIVIIARDRGRETSAKSDITSIMTALKQLHSDYGKVLAKSGTDLKIGNTKIFTRSGFNNIAIFGIDDTNRKSEDAYDAMIAELTAPKNGKFSSTNPVSVNKRKKIYLEPRKEFNPEVDYDNQVTALYRDPWGNPYKVYVNIMLDDRMTIPYLDDDTGLKPPTTISGNFAVYSFGANGEDDRGCNSEFETCLVEDSTEKSNHKKHDDIASWWM